MKDQFQIRRDKLRHLIKKDGMSGIVSIDASETKFGITVPVTSIVNNRTVFVARNGKAFGVHVEHSMVSQGKSFIKKGLSENDTIIVSGISQLADGDTVSVSISE